MTIAVLSADEIKTSARAFLAKFFKTIQVQDDDDIFAMGFVNSLFAMQLVMFIEKEFGLAVEDEDLNIDNFRTINTITELVLGKL
jgi:methoxymalonate biosynthesis acyl carrier protein